MEDLVRKRILRRTLGTGALSLAFLMTPTMLTAASATTSTPVPDRFLVATTSFATATRGYVVGTGACADGRCPYVLTTADGGKSWEQRTLPDKHLRFRLPIHIVSVPGESTLDGATVYLTNGKWLFASHDGATTWTRVRLIGANDTTHVGSIATTADRVYAIVGNGTLDAGRTRLLEGTLAGDELRGAPGVEVEDNAVNVDGGWNVVADNKNVAVSLGRIFVNSAYWTSHDGVTFTKADPACTQDQVTALGDVSDSRVAALCSYNPGMGHMFKDLKVSADDGPFEGAGSAPELGLTEQYVSTGPGEDTITTISGASILYRSDGKGGWEQPLFIGGGPPFADLQYATDKVGYVVWGGPINHKARLYKTTDGGHTWKPLASLG